MRSLTHLSESDFVAYLNNEVAPWRRGFMRRHLLGCWICRCRVGESEEVLRRLADQVQRWPRVDEESTRRAKAQFRKRILAEEPLETQRAASRFAGWKIAAVCAVGAAVVLLYLAIGGSLKDPLHRAREAEDRQVADATIRQEFELELSPADAFQSTTRIELVSDRLSGRFAVNWRNEDGSLIYGLWRPSADRVLAYRAAEHTGVRPVRSPRRERSEVTRFPSGAAIEKAVAEWLEFRELAPIRLAYDGFLTSTLGELGQPAQVAERNGRVIMRWDAAEPYEAVRLLLQLDAGTFLPISQTLKVDSSLVQVKIRLVSQTSLNGASLDIQTFEPSQLLVMARAERPRPPSAFEVFFGRQN